MRVPARDPPYREVHHQRGRALALELKGVCHGEATAHGGGDGAGWVRLPLYAPAEPPNG